MMSDKIIRRSFLKRLFSLMAFSAGSVFSFKADVPESGESGSIKIGTQDVQARDSDSKVRKIAVEEHANKQDIEQLDKRLKDMDEAGIDMQVISFARGETKGLSASEDLSAAKSINDMLAGIAEKYPERLAFYTTLPMRDPDGAARELERAVKNLGLKGPMIFSGHDGSYVDDRKFWGIYETAEKLDVPVYIHPGELLPDMREPYMTYPILSYAMWGFAAATSLHAVRLIVSGVFDRYPGLKIMLGHMGEGISYWFWRMDKHYVTDQAMIEKDAPGNNLKRDPSQYFKENFYVTTSGMCWQPVLQFVLSVVGADRILFACDYPPEPALEGSQFIDSMPLSAGDREKICHLNAEKLLRI